MNNPVVRVDWFARDPGGSTNYIAPRNPTRAQVESALTHDDHCRKYGEHVDCCGADDKCSCSVSQAINDLVLNGWVQLADDHA